MRVLVTGGAGFIGSHIVEALLARGDAVLVVDDLSTGSAANLPAGADFERLDIRDDRLVAVSARYGVEAVVHAAAQSSVPASVADPMRDADVNIVGGLTVREAAEAAGCRRFVYITTGGALYGDPATLPADEDCPIRPLSPYGLSKWALERYLALLLPPSMPLAVLRLANVYGPRQDACGEAAAVAVFAARMTRGEAITINGDGEQTRDFVYVRDVAHATLLALDGDAPLTVNISSGTATSINQLFALVASSSGYERPPLYGPVRPGDVRHSVLDNRRARRLLGWEPRTTLVTGLDETLAWVREQRSDARPPTPDPLRTE